MKESLLLVFANKQDIPGGMYPFHTKKDELVLTIICSYETPRSNRCPKTLAAERQDLVRGAQLRDDWRGVTGRLGIFPMSPPPQVSLANNKPRRGSPTT